MADMEKNTKSIVSDEEMRAVTGGAGGDEIKIKCDYCKKMFPRSIIQEHMKKCSQK